MTKQEFLEQLASSLNEDPSEIKPDTEVESLAGWDSTGLLGVIATLDGTGTQVNVDLLRSCRTIGDIIELAKDNLE